MWCSTHTKEDERCEEGCLVHYPVFFLSIAALLQRMEASLSPAHRRLRGEPDGSKDARRRVEGARAGEQQREESTSVGLVGGTILLNL
jgi:hypothetical protein